MTYHEAEPPLAAPRPKRRGRKKRLPGHNLALRLRDCRESMRRFLHESAVPVTPNQAEQDMRMRKVRQKVSGGFWSEQGCRTSPLCGACCRVRGSKAATASDLAARARRPVLRFLCLTVVRLSSPGPHRAAAVVDSLQRPWNRSAGRPRQLPGDISNGYSTLHSSRAVNGPVWYGPSVCAGETSTDSGAPVPEADAFGHTMDRLGGCAESCRRGSQGACWIARTSCAREPADGAALSASTTDSRQGHSSGGGGIPRGGGDSTGLGAESC